jgi:hypothetical protein
MSAIDVPALRALVEKNETWAITVSKETATALLDAFEERETMRLALENCDIVLRTSRVFLLSREKSHPVGVELYDECYARVRAALEINVRATLEGTKP